MSGAEAASPPEGNIYQQILTQLSDSVTTNTTAAASSPAPKKEASEPPKTELVHSSTEEKHGSKAHEKKHAHGHAHHGHGHSHSHHKHHKKQKKHGAHHKHNTKKPEKFEIKDVEVELIKGKANGEEPKQAAASTSQAEKDQKKQESTTADVKSAVQTEAKAETKKEATEGKAKTGEKKSHGHKSEAQKAIQELKKSSKQLENKVKKLQVEDDPSDKIEETFAERAVIHKAVKKIDNTEGEDLIDSFINEQGPSSATNSWLSENVEADKSATASDTSISSSTASSLV